MSEERSEGIYCVLGDEFAEPHMRNETQTISVNGIDMEYVLIDGKYSFKRITPKNVGHTVQLVLSVFLGVLIGVTCQTIALAFLFNR